jgi:hypothetical protein
LKISFEQIIDQIPANALSVLFFGDGFDIFAAELSLRYPAAKAYSGAIASGSAGQRIYDAPLEVVEYIQDAKSEPLSRSEVVGFKVEVVVTISVHSNELGLMAWLNRIDAWLEKSGLLIIVEQSPSHWTRFRDLLSKQPFDFGLMYQDRNAKSELSRQELIDALLASGFQIERESTLQDRSAELETFKAKIGPLIDYLGIEPTTAYANLKATHHVIRAAKEAITPSLNLLALTLKPMAGVNEARIDYPLRTLNSLPNVSCSWTSGSLSLPKRGNNGVILFHRQFLNAPGMMKQLSDLVQKGWTLVSEIDDNPYHWKQYIESDFVAFSGVHAVSVSTKPLAELVQRWNPNLAVFENAIFRLPEMSHRHAAVGESYRIFFGALNRQSDWEVIRESVLSACRMMEDKVTLVIVHDRQIFDSIGDGIKKEFYPTLSHQDYMIELSRSDVALLPLQNNVFNRYKSDLKLIECCAAGAVPIFSSVVYGDNLQHSGLGIMMGDTSDWGAAILRACNPAFLETKRAMGVEYVKKERMHHHLAERRLEWFSQLVANREYLEEERQRRLGWFA